MKIEILRTTGKFKLIEKILKDLDSLYDDLTYDSDAKDEACIRSRIKIREDILKTLNNE